MTHQLLTLLLRKSDFLFVAGQFPREIDLEMKIVCRRLTGEGALRKNS